MVCLKKKLMMVVVVVVVVLVYGGRWAEAEAEVQHVVGEDRGWEVASDVASWAAGRAFMVGDSLWFAYSGGIDNSIVELKSKEEFESCDVSNPIKMYTDGVDKISLNEEGIRYFASANPETCRKGLKLPIEIKPKSAVVIQSSLSSNVALPLAVAQQPTAPSSSTKISGSTLFIIALIIVYLMMGI